MQYAMDRTSPVPEFYTLREKEADVNLSYLFGEVLAESDGRYMEGFFMVGIVSKQSPFGQGIYCQVHSSKLRRATNGEVLRALDKDHSYGADFTLCSLPDIFKIRNNLWAFKNQEKIQCIVDDYALRQDDICRDQTSAIFDALGQNTQR